MPICGTIKKEVFPFKYFFNEGVFYEEIQIDLPFTALVVTSLC